MQSKKSLIHTPLTKAISKKNRYLSNVTKAFIYCLIVIDFFSEGAFTATLVSVFVVSNLLLTAIYASQVQGFMIDPKQANYLASFPIEPSVMWFSQYIAGLKLVLYPVIFESFWIGFSLLLVSNSIGRGSIILITMFVATITVWIYYSISFMICCMTKNKISQIIYTISITLLSMIVLYGLQYISAILAGRLTGGLLDYSVLVSSVPVVGAINCIEQYIYSSTFIFENLGIYILLTFLSIAVSYYSFSTRKIEEAGTMSSSFIVDMLFKGMICLLGPCVITIGAIYLEAIYNFENIYYIIAGIFIVSAFIVFFVLEYKMPSKNRVFSFIGTALFVLAGIQTIGTSNHSLVEEFDAIVREGNNDILLKLHLDSWSSGLGYSAIGISADVYQNIDTFVKENADKVYLMEQDNCDKIEFVVSNVSDQGVFYYDQCKTYYFEEGFFDESLRTGILDAVFSDEYRLQSTYEDSAIYDYSKTQLVTILDAKSMQELKEMTNQIEYNYFDYLQNEVGYLENGEKFFISDEIYDFIKESQDKYFIYGAMGSESYLTQLGIYEQEELIEYCEKQNISITSYEDLEQMRESMIIDIDEGIYSLDFHVVDTVGLRISFRILDGQVIGILKVGKVGTN